MSHGTDGHAHDLLWDHLILALGSSTNFFGLPGVQERALTVRSIGDAMALRKTMLALQEKEKLVEILESCLDEEGLQILIGSETDFTQVHNFSLVARRYGSSQAPLGMVGIIGPMRMEYARIAPLVDYLSRVLSRKIEEGELQQ